MDHFNNLIERFNDLNLNLDHEGLLFLHEFIKNNKRIGIIGIDPNIDLLCDQIINLPYHPDLFDQSKQFSNVNNILPELERNFDLLILVSNKKDIITSRIPIIKLTPKNVFLEINGNPGSGEVLKWLESLNFDLKSIEAILIEDENQNGFLKNKPRKSKDYLTLQEKNQYLIEEALIDNNQLFLFEKPIKIVKPLGHLNYFDLINPFYITQEEKTALDFSDVIFIEKSLVELTESLTEKETLIFRLEDLDKIFEKTLQLIKDSKTVSIIVNENNSDYFKGKVTKFFRDYSNSLFSFPSINWINLIESIFDLRLNNYLKVEAKEFLDYISHLKILLKSKITLILELKENTKEDYYKELYSHLETIFNEDREIKILNIKTGLAYKTTLEFLDLSKEISYIII